MLPNVLNEDIMGKCITFNVIPIWINLFKENQKFNRIKYTQEVKRQKPKYFSKNLSNDTVSWKR